VRWAEKASPSGGLVISSTSLALIFPILTRQQIPQRTDLDGEESRHESKSDQRVPGRRLFFREQPPAKPADEKRHRHKNQAAYTVFAISKAQRLWVSMTGSMSTVTTPPSRTMTLPLMTVNFALCGAQKSVAATGSCNAPA
jgi:hypothetical protein